MKYTLLRWLIAVPKKISLAATAQVAIFAGTLFWYGAIRRRRMAIEAVMHHLGLSREEALPIARQSFIENMYSFLELFHLDEFSSNVSRVEIKNKKLLQQMENEEHPIVVGTAHIGSWEFMAALSSQVLPKRKSMAVVRTQKDEAVNRIIFDLRGARGMQIIGHRQASTLVLQGLRDHGLVGFLVDHNCSRKEAVFLPFLADIAAVNSGPALLALRAKAAVYPAFLLRNGKGGYILEMGEPLYTHTLEGSIAERVAVIARFYTDAVADIVKRYPSQWFWMHNRWKTRP